MRVGIAFPWLATAISVLHPAYREIGAAWLARLGVPDDVMFATCAVELVLAIWILSTRPWWVQSALQLTMLASFTAILAWMEPMLLAHPFGVLTKNVPLAMLILARETHARDGLSERTTWLLRAGVAFIWISEGLFPKIALQQQMELDVVARSGLVTMMSPSDFLWWLGVAQAISGAIVLLLRPGRLLAALLIGQAFALVVLPVLVSLHEPTLWVHPFGPLIKNVPILCATLLLARICVHAGRPPA
jgi:hypothetical protein